MADNFIQAGVGPTGTTTDQVTLTGVTAGSALVAFLWDGNNASGPTTHTVADGQGSYTSRGPSALDATNNVWCQAFVLENANAGSHTITGTIDTGNACFLVVVEVGSSGASFSGANSQFQSGPGTGTDAVSSGSATVSAASTLVAMATDSSSTVSSDEPNAGTGFTTRSNNTNGVVGAWRVETKAVAANAAGTFTAPTGAHSFVTAAVAILNTAGGGAAADAYLSMPPMAPPRR